MLSSNRPQKGKLQRHAVVVRRKVATAIAFATTIFLICIENTKSFTTPLFAPNALLNENTFSFWTSSRLAKRFKLSPSKLSLRSISKNGYDTSLASMAGASPNINSRKFHTTSLRMSHSVAPSTSAPLMLDMKTTINAFGGWYNELDPLARPSVYYEDEDSESYVTDYTFSSPSDSWPTPLDNDSATLNRSRMTSERSNPNPIRAIRRIAGWVSRTTPFQRIRGIL